MQTYPTYKVPESYWKSLGGYGVLSPRGMKQMYEFGGYIKKYYENFLTVTYDKSRVYAKSTDYDRTLQSMSSFLAGLYSPNGFQKWNPDLNWFPIPVHTTSLATDQVCFAVFLNVSYKF